MRYHKFKGSPAKNIVLADSQLKHLRFPNANILSLPGARIRDLTEYYPSKGQYDRIVLFIGGNDLFKGFHQSTAEPQEVAELALLADELVPLASKKVYVVAIPPGGQDTANNKRTKATNDFINDLAENSRWKYRGISSEIYSIEKHLDEDDVHLTGSALGGICTILKKKIIYPENYSTALNHVAITMILDRSEKFYISPWMQYSTTLLLSSRIGLTRK